MSLNKQERESFQKLMRQNLILAKNYYHCLKHLATMDNYEKHKDRILQLDAYIRNIERILHDR